MALDLSFTSLADIAQSGGGGRPVEIPLDEIIEDPSQPRTVFDDEELRQLANSIARVGVIQAISVRPKNAEGKHVILFGARRYRASRLAGRERIRAVVEDADSPDAYLQLVENIQRDDLKPMEIAAFVTGRIQAGDRVSAIAERLGKPKDWVSRYGAVGRMPAFLQDKLATSPIRAVYELFQAWRDHPDAVERLAQTHEAFTDAEARRLAQSLRKPTADSVDPVAPAGHAASEVPDDAGFRRKGRAPSPSVAPDHGGSAASPRGHASCHRDPGEVSLSEEVRRLEQEAETLATPMIAQLMAHYAVLSARLERELADAHEVLLSRKAALQLIRLAAEAA
jgi:ParB family chromosome partitioning protein